MNQPPILCVAVVLVRNGKVLMGRRLGSVGNLEFQFPGGNVDANETIEDAGVREALEETGLHVARPVHVVRQIEEIGGSHFDTHFVAYLDTHGEPERTEPQKCEGWDWVSPEADHSRPLFFTSEETMATIAEFVRNYHPAAF